MERLKKRPEYLYVARGERWVTTSFVLQVRKRASDENLPARTGFTASRKVGNAVLRNRARRRLKEAARLGLQEHLLLGHDYVVVARGAAQSYSFSKLLNDMTISARRVHKKLIRYGLREEERPSIDSHTGKGIAGHSGVVRKP
jgi:ribonuclease P protein component